LWSRRSATSSETSTSSITVMCAAVPLDTAMLRAMAFRIMESGSYSTRGTSGAGAAAGAGAGAAVRSRS